MFISKQVSFASHFQRPGTEIGSVTIHKVRDPTGDWGDLKSVLGGAKSKEWGQGKKLGE